MAHYDVIVVGGGHAGIEASLAAARLGLATLLVTLRASTVGELSCNPAFGGPAKGGLVREVDALGGWCSRGADLAAIQCRILGESKGPATRATRNLVDRAEYARQARAFLADQAGLHLMEAEAAGVRARHGRAEGVVLAGGTPLSAGAVVLTGGTFWNGRIWNGLEGRPGGRFGEAPATLIRGSLSALGHRMGRLSTSTAPRLAAATVDWDCLGRQPGDPLARPFSVLSGPPRNTAFCRLTWTNAETHRIVSENLRTSKIYADDPVQAGPRYCPSLEDKVRRFPHRERHQVFLEPDGPDLVYPSGLPTGLAPPVQQALINTIPGLERAVVARPGYAIEYDVCDPTQLEPTLESTLIRGLFLAGQINGTSGYEEAASQGLWAGLGAGRRSGGLDPVPLGRDQALLGVMLDDLTVAGVSEPYRMFTSRAEWRLSLREDNADLRLSPLADSLGLLDARRRTLLAAKIAGIELGRRLLREARITPAMAADLRARFGLDERVSAGATVTAYEFLRRPSVAMEHLLGAAPSLEAVGPAAALTLETEIKYEGYLAMQAAQTRQAAAREGSPVPPDLDYRLVPGLSGEAVEILSARRPKTLGQAGRLRGVTPAAVSALMIHLRKIGGPRPEAPPA